MWGRALVCLSVLPWPLASAAPWVQREEFLYTRASISSEIVDDENGWRGDAYLEYGLTDRWTVTAKIEAITNPLNPTDDQVGGRLTFRSLLYETDNLTLSAEVGLLQGAPIGGRNGCNTPGMEWRGGAAWSQKLLGQDAYIFAELVRRDHEACARDRIELGAGLQLARQVFTSTQVWIEDGAPSAPSEKVQSELIWRQGHSDYAIGYRAELGDAFEEEAIFLAYALRY